MHTLEIAQSSWQWSRTPARDSISECASCLLNALRC